MKFRTKIHYVLSISTIVLLLGLTPYMSIAQCPKAIICDPTRGLGLLYDPLPSTRNGANTYLDFGPSDTRTGYYQAERYPTDPDVAVRNTMFYNVRCSSGLNNLKITFNDANHTYCGPTSSCYDFVFFQNGAYFKTFLDNQGFQSDLTGCKKWEGACGTDGTIYRKQNVAIGNVGFSGGAYALSVAGKILTEQYKVQQQLCYDYTKGGFIWCDYVFEDTYKLMSLEEVEKAIQQDKHLPKTKSAEEIKKEQGMDAAETLLNHQEKIEEIFLHLIALDKQLNLSNNNK